MSNKWKKIPASARFILSGQLIAQDDLPAGCLYRCTGMITLKDSIPLDCEFGMMQFTDCFGEHLIASHYRIKSDLLQIYDTEVSIYD